MKHKFNDLSKIERLGFLLYQISEKHLKVGPDGDLCYVSIEPDDDLNLDELVNRVWLHRKEHRRGDHNGHCVGLNAVCGSCAWELMTGSGSDLAMAFKNTALWKNDDVYNFIYKLHFEVDQSEFEYEQCRTMTDYFIKKCDELELWVVT